LYNYDSGGNLTKRTEAGGKVTQFSYNASGRLIRVATGDDQVIAKYGYDPNGRRIWKEQFRDIYQNLLAQPIRTYFLYADEGLVAEATQPITSDGIAISSATLATQYGVRPDALFNTSVLFVKTKDSGGNKVVAYLQNDQRGAPVQAINRQGNVVWSASYDAFGNAQVANPTGNQEVGYINLSLRLPGQTYNDETGLHYNYFRDYDPKTGRYLQSDPAGLRGGINTYAYVGGNPVTRIDPLGLWSTVAHNYFIDKFAEMHPELKGQWGFIDEMKAGSRYTDSSAFQNDQSSYMHAMSSDSLSRDQAKDMMCKYVKAYMDAYRGGSRGPDSTGKRYYYLGMAMHAVMDSTSPAHVGFQYWGGMWDSVIHGYAFDHGGADWSPFSDESKRHAIAREAETINKMNEIMSGDYSSICNCK
jgi:RHS repeat-associated protein